MFIDRNSAEGALEHRVRRFYPAPLAGANTPWSIEIFNPADDPERWRRHRLLAARCYERRALGTVSRNRDIVTLESPTRTVDAMLDGLLIGGGQIHMVDARGALPLQAEVEPYVDRAIFQNFVSALKPEGVVQMAGLWVAQGYNSTDLAGDLGRACLAVVASTQARYYLGVCHQFILGAWRSLGFEPVLSFGSFPYPDARYQTWVILGDVRRWPDDLARWAQQQGEQPRLSQATPYRVEPMRSSVLVSCF